MSAVHGGTRSKEERSGVGNTKLRHAAVTIFGSTLNDVTEICQDHRISYCICQNEVCPETKRNHIQAYFQFTRPINFKTVKNILPPGSHIEIARGTAEENRAYCSKKETRLADSEPLEIGTLRQQGQRNDLVAIKRKIDEGSSEADICAIDDLFGTWAKYPNLFKRYKSARIPPRNRNEPPEVNVIVGATGSGKTRRVYDSMGDDVYMKDSSKWWDGYTGQKAILLDEFSSKEHFSIEEMLRLLDRYPYQGQTKGGYVNVNSPHIFITSNIPLEQHFINITQEQLDALNRRITNQVQL